MKIYIGIDPGLSGGIAVIPEFGEPWAIKMPDTNFDTFEVFRDLKAFAQGDPIFALIEKVSAMPGQGVTSCFTFGMGYGALRMALVATLIPHETVTPQKWQKAMGCLTKGDKNVSKRKAQELFPSLKITHATADALLIAEHCKRTRD